MQYPCNQCDYKAKQKIRLKKHMSMKQQLLFWRSPNVTLLRWISGCEFWLNSKFLLSTGLKEEIIILWVLICLFSHTKVTLQNSAASWNLCQNDLILLSNSFIINNIDYLLMNINDYLIILTTRNKSCDYNKESFH